jgi:hypothetical protein
MMFELWDLVSRNLIDFFEGRQEAIDAVQAYVDANEADEVVLLEYADEDGVDERSMTGSDLIRWLDEARAAVR